MWNGDSDMSKSPLMQKFLDDFTRINTGVSASVSQAVNHCVWCHKSATEFRDPLSVKEYEISGLCQECQDKVFPPNV